MCRLSRLLAQESLQEERAGGGASAVRVQPQAVEEAAREGGAEQGRRDHGVGVGLRVADRVGRVRACGRVRGGEGDEECVREEGVAVQAE